MSGGGRLRFADAVAVHRIRTSSFKKLAKKETMTTLNHYLSEKRSAVLAREALINAGDAGPVALAAKVSAEGRSGVRRIRIRDHQVISDSPPDFAGYNLGPSSPELQLGVLGSCVTHIFLIHAAHQQVPVESLEVEVTGKIDPRGGKPGYEDIPIYPHDIAYTVHLVSPASKESVQALFATVEKTCPILNLLKNPQTIRAEIRHTASVANKLEPERAIS
ncbi:putative redox protein, regulator of disulfide bond formation [Herbaspirillum sp. CF444]|nr:putative redox protein, regulator of disulfide bond formation [Herbaspirillum sp. CF444]